MEQSTSLVEEFDSLLEDDRQTRQASQLDPQVYFLQLLHMSSLSEDRRSEQLSAAQQQILQLVEEVNSLQSQLQDREQVSVVNDPVPSFRF